MPVCSAGARLSRAQLLTFPHNAAPALAGLLGTHRSHYRHCLVMTEGVFSMDGDLAPLPEMSAAARAHDAWLLTDDAHGLGVTGGGRGSSFAFGEPLDIPLQMGTLSKAVGAYGGYLCASGPVIDLLRNRARSSSIPRGCRPATVAAAIRSLDIIASDPSLCERPLEHARLFTRVLGLQEAQSPIVPVILHEERSCPGGIRRAARGGVPGDRHPSALGARGHVAPALHVHSRAPPGGHSPARSARAADPRRAHA